MAQTGGPNVQYGVPKPTKVRKVKPPIGPPAPTGPPAPKRVVRSAGPAGPLAPRKVVRKAVGPAGPIGRQLTGPAAVQHGHQQQAVLNAKQGRPFNPTHLHAAIKAGIAPDVTETNGVFSVKVRRNLLPDYQAVVRPSGKNNALPSKSERQAQLAAAPGEAPVLKVLETTAIPSHAIAGIVSGRGAGYGIRHKTNFGQILKKAGVPGAVAGVAGFAADVATDPTTYATFGAGSIAEKAALKASRDASAQAARQAAEAAAKETARAGSRSAAKTTAAAQRASDAILQQGEVRAQKAYVRAASSGPQGKGLTVKFAGKQVPGVTKSTAAAGRVIKRTAATAPQPLKNATTGARNLVADVRPTLRPSGVTEQQFQGVRSASRQTRAQVNQQLALIDHHAHGLHAQIGPDNFAKVIDHIEKGKVLNLADNAAEIRAARKAGRPVPKPTGDLHGPAVFLRSQFRHAQKLRKQAGLGEGSIRDYFPHAQQDALAAGKGVDTTTPAPQVKGTGRIVSYPGSSKHRSLAGPVSEVNPQLAEQGRGQFSTDIPLVYSNYQRETAKTVASADLAKRLASAGRSIKPGKDFQLGQGERVYQLGFDSSKSSHVVGQTKKGGDVVVREAKGKGRFGLRPLSPQEEQALTKPGSFHPGQYVALHEQTVADAAAQSAPYQSSTAIGRTLDRTTRTFKRIATMTPGFHGRNAVGDVQQGYLSQPGHRLLPNLLAVRKAITGLHNQQKAAENLALGTDVSGKTIKVAGQKMPVDQFLKLAQQHGVTQSGAITREFQDLAESAAKGAKRIQVGGAVKRTARKVGQSPPVRALMQDRENIVRLATFKHGLDTGLPVEHAANLSLGTHIDYGDLTHFERKYARRLAPFYTFSARALPLHVKTLLTKPGKFANIEKAREEIGGTNVSGYTPFQQRQVPVNVGKVGITDSLPLTTLNEVPVSKKPGDYGSELYQFAANLVNPALKDPVEYGANHSFAFRNPLQDPKRPLVSAPDWAGHLPSSVRKQLGIVQGPDRNGKIVWKWPGKHDYALKSVALGPFNIANQLATTGTNRVGQGTTQKAVAGLTGVRINPQDKVSVAINAKYDQLNTLTEKQAALGEQINPKNRLKISAKNPTPEFKANAAQLKNLERDIYQLSKQRGDKTLPRVGAPKKVRRRGGGFGGGGFDSGFGGGYSSG